MTMTTGTTTDGARVGAAMPRTDPESVGLSSDRLQRIATVTEGRVERGEIPGAVALIARHGRIAYLRAHGYIDLESRAPMPEDAIFPLRSVTKPITTVAVLTLLEEGRLRLDEPVARTLPEFESPLVVTLDGARAAPPGHLPLVPAEQPVTIRHLLTHTGGLTGGVRTPMGLARAVQEALRGVPELAHYVLVEVAAEPRRTIREAVRALAGVPLSFQPGTAWDYGLSHDVAGVVAEVVSGQTLDELFGQRVLEPLGMRDTFFHVPPERLHRLVSLYRAVPATGGWELAPREVRSQDEYWAVGPRDLFMGGNGLLSTVPDVARFAQMLLGRGALGGVRLLGRRTVQTMMSNQTGDLHVSINPRGYGFGLGGNVCVAPSQSPTFASAGTYGWGGGYGTYFFVDPSEDMVGVYTTTVLGAGAGLLLGGILGSEFHRLAYQALAD